MLSALAFFAADNCGMAQQPSIPLLTAPNSQDRLSAFDFVQTSVSHFNYLVSLVSKPPIKAFMSSQVAGAIWKAVRRQRL